MADTRAFDPALSLFPNALATDNPINLPLSTISARIGSEHDAAVITSLRRTLAAGKREGYKSAKTGLPAITATGTFSRRKKAWDNQASQSGLLPLDLDFATKDPAWLAESEALRDRIAQDPCVAVAFVSPSGAGVKVWLRIPPYADDDAYRALFHDATRYFNATYPTCPTDDVAADISRLCFLSWDPGVYVNHDAVIFPGKALARRLLPLVHALYDMADGQRNATRARVGYTVGGLLAGGQMDEACALAYFDTPVHATTQHPGLSWRSFVQQMDVGKAKPIIDDDAPQGARVVPDMTTAPDAPGASATTWHANAPRGRPADAHLVGIPLDGVVPEEIAWLWRPYIPLGAITMLEGDPGNGKTFLALAIAAAYTQGLCLPGQDGRFTPTTTPVEATCLYISEEDDLATVIKKRYDSMDVPQAAQKRFIAITGWKAGEEDHPFSFEVLDLLDTYIADTGATLVIIDPVTDFIGAKVDIYRQNEVAPILSAINLIAAKHQCAFLLVRHWVKAIGASARARGMGSVAFTQKARSLLSLGDSLEKDGVKVMAHAKVNAERIGASQTFSLENGIFAWAGTEDVSAEALVQQQPKAQTLKREHAAHWLLDTLKDGDIPSTSILAIGAALGYSENTVRRAKTELGDMIRPYKIGKTWYWGLTTRQGED